jgi:hypothetical protein
MYCSAGCLNDQEGKSVCHHHALMVGQKWYNIHTIITRLTRAAQSVDPNGQPVEPTAQNFFSVRTFYLMTRCMRATYKEGPLRKLESCILLICCTRTVYHMHGRYQMSTSPGDSTATTLVDYTLPTAVPLPDLRPPARQNQSCASGHHVSQQNSRVCDCCQCNSAVTFKLP